MPEGRMATALQGSVQNEKADSFLKNYENFKTYKNFEGLIHGTPALYPLPLVLLYLFYHISVHPSIHPAILIGDAFPRSKLQTWEHFTLSIPGCIL